MNSFHERRQWSPGCPSLTRWRRRRSRFRLLRPYGGSDHPRRVRSASATPDYMGWSRRRYRNWRDSAAGWLASHSAWVSQSGPKSTTTTPRDTSIRIGARARRARLAELVTQLSGDVEDWRRSLWKAWTIDGLAGGRGALAVKMSPVLTDRGHGVASVWERLLTSRPNDSADVRRGRPAWGHVPSRERRHRHNERDHREQHRGYLDGRRSRDGCAARQCVTERAARPWIVWPRRRRGGPVPHTVFNAPLTKRRSMAFASIRLADVRTVSEAFRGQHSQCRSRRLLNVHARLDAAVRPSFPPEPLLMQVPLSVPAGDPAKAGKSLATGQVRLPVQPERPGTGAHQPPYSRRAIELARLPR